MAFVNSPEAFAQDMEKLGGDPQIDEVELYETWELTNNKSYCFDAIRKYAK